MRFHDVEISEQAIADFCRRHRIARLSLFGSILTNDFTPESDVDVLVEFEAGVGVSLLTLGAVAYALESMFRRKVDLMEPSWIPEKHRPGIMRDAKVLHAA